MSPASSSHGLREFARRVQKARVARGYHSRPALAEAIGVSTDAVYTWERGRNFPSWPDALALRNALGVTLDWLMVGDTAGLSAEAFNLLVGGHPR